MGKKDPRVDAYIEKSEDFAKPILRHLRAVMHAACPEVEETIKWRFPVFMYEGMLADMASFKAHCTFGFWKGSLVFDEIPDEADDAMGQFGRITTLDDLPPESELNRLIHKAMHLNEKGIQPKKKGKKKPELEMPDDFAAALDQEEGTRKAFEALSPSHRYEYLEWILDAKRDETRKRRIKKAVNQISEGKSLNWKYM